MTYNVFSGTLNSTQSITDVFSIPTLSLPVSFPFQPLPFYLQVFSQMHFLTPNEQCQSTKASEIIVFNLKTHCLTDNKIRSITVKCTKALACERSCRWLEMYHSSKGTSGRSSAGFFPSTLATLLSITMGTAQLSSIPFIFQ